MIDSHCHLDFDIFDTSRPLLIEAMVRAGVDHCVVPGVAAAAWEDLLCVVNDFKQCSSALGLHPYFIADHREQDLQRLDQLLGEHENIVAVGEIGLDATLMAGFASEQQYYFEQQLVLAKRHNLPVIIHARGCFDQVAATIRRSHFNQGGIVHAFTGSLQQGVKLAELGFKLGIGGAVTHPRARKLRQTVAALAPDCIALETDSPDMRPAFVHHDSPNMPTLLPLIAAVVAEIRGTSATAIAAQSDANILSALPRLQRVAG
ncbi:putative metal-dependent hydrolase YjjV [Sinobacterium norvegicum]|uniref:Metal-dependent hydrolase YjjV n=1 Tax=Sinobacterium norvegicum TaxID=1641715 RepID=A0ABM9AJ88_9GAMM|nr:TatD family hydrolase [Sinobacterium norvegicum]CAH0993299.1 putative metal-dependent hydrolase YjjV [Sinobacterium norvegicum]